MKQSPLKPRPPPPRRAATPTLTAGHDGVRLVPIPCPTPRDLNLPRRRGCVLEYLRSFCMSGLYRGVAGLEKLLPVQERSSSSCLAYIHNTH